MIGKPLGVALLASAVIVLVPATARAWCRTTTNEAFSATEEQPCDQAGKPLFWRSRCAGFSLQARGSTTIPRPTLERTLRSAFDAWANVECPSDTRACSGTLRGRPSISAVDLGAVSCDLVEYNPKASNANIVVFRTGELTNPRPGETLAKTRISFNALTGEIYDADMEIVDSPELTTGDIDAIYDLESILSHEAGHFFGLAHTQGEHRDATMIAGYPVGTLTKRTPERDDACGLCAAYPPERAAACAPAPRRGLASACRCEGDAGACENPDRDDSESKLEARGGCSATGASAGHATYVALLALAAVYARRRSPSRSLARAPGRAARVA